MGYAVGEEGGRTIGYGVPAPCDYPGCDKEIDRGLGYKCEDAYSYDEETDTEAYEPDDACGLFFCSDHETGSCPPEHHTFEPKPDPAGWLLFQLGHESWERWRQESPRNVEAIKQKLADPEVRADAIAYVRRNVDEDEVEAVLSVLS